MTSPTFKKMNDLFKRLDVSYEHLNQQVKDQTPSRRAASREQTQEQRRRRLNRDVFSLKKLDNGVRM